MQDPAGHVTRYGADAAGQRTSVTDPLGSTTQQYADDPVGNTTIITTPLDYAQPSALSVETRQYDALNEPISITLAGVGESIPTPPQTTIWSYDHDGNVIGQILPAGDQTQSTFDGADRRTAVSVLTNPPAMQALTLDPADNLIQQADFNQRTHTLSVDGDNRLQTTTYGYDQSGDTTAITAPNGLSYSLSYDALGRLAGVARLDPADSTCCSVLIAYDALGRRASYTAVAAGPTAPPPPFQELFQYRGNQVSQIVVSGTNTTPFTETFTYRPDGSPLALLYQRQDGQGHNQATARYWYVLDGQGSVVALTDSTGAVVDSYAYDLWGQQISGSESIPQPLRYHSYWWDGWDNMLSTPQDQGWNGGALPWYWLGAREYDPALERFLQPDPSAQDGVRSYVYCHDQPVDCTDPSGLDGEPDQGASGDEAAVSGALDALTGQSAAPLSGVQGAAISADPEALPASIEEGVGAVGTAIGDSTSAPLAGFDEDAAVAQAEAARDNLGYAPRDKVVAAIRLGLRTVSGWRMWFPGEGMSERASRSDLGFEGPVELEVLARAKFRGYRFATDKIADQGTPGRAAASHAETQLDYLAPGEPMATSWAMCDSCVDYLRFQAIDTGIPRTVAEPKAALVFYPDGSIVVRGPLGRYIFHLDGTIERP